MPGLAVVPNPYPDQILDVTWPIVTLAASGAAFQVSGNPRYGIATSYTVFSAAIGTATQNMGEYKNVFGGQWTSDGIGNIAGRGMSGFAAAPVLSKPAGATSVLVMPEQTRCYGWTFLMCTPALVNYTALSGFVIQVAAGVVPGWINGGNAGFGVVGDGAGGWRWVSKSAAGVGVYDESVPLVWPDARDEWVRVDHVIQGASGSGGATYQLWLNNQLQLTRDWTGTLGVALPGYGAASAPANAAGMVPLVQCGEAALAGQVNLGFGRYQVGRFHPVTGLQVGG